MTTGCVAAAAGPLSHITSSRVTTSPKPVPTSMSSSAPRPMLAHALARSSAARPAAPWPSLELRGPYRAAASRPLCRPSHTTATPRTPPALHHRQCPYTPAAQISRRCRCTFTLQAPPRHQRPSNSASTNMPLRCYRPRRPQTLPHRRRLSNSPGPTAQRRPRPVAAPRIPSASPCC